MYVIKNRQNYVHYHKVNQSVIINRIEYGAQIYGKGSL